MDKLKPDSDTLAILLGGLFAGGQWSGELDLGMLNLPEGAPPVLAIALVVLYVGVKVVKGKIAKRDLEIAELKKENHDQEQRIVALELNRPGAALELPMMPLRAATTDVAGTTVDQIVMRSEERTRQVLEELLTGARVAGSEDIMGVRLALEQLVSDLNRLAQDELDRGRRLMEVSEQVLGAEGDAHRFEIDQVTTRRLAFDAVELVGRLIDELQAAEVIPKPPAYKNLAGDEVERGG